MQAAPQPFTAAGPQQPPPPPPPSVDTPLLSELEQQYFSDFLGTFDDPDELIPTGSLSSTAADTPSHHHYSHHHMDIPPHPHLCSPPHPHHVPKQSVPLYSQSLPIMQAHHPPLPQQLHRYPQQPQPILTHQLQSQQTPEQSLQHQSIPSSSIAIPKGRVKVEQPPSGTPPSSSSSLNEHRDLAHAHSPTLEEKSSTGNSKGKGKKRNGRELLTEEQKRANHIQSEQKRRGLIREGFKALSDLVPGLKGGNIGTSKSVILFKTVAFIRELEESNRAMEEQLNMIYAQQSAHTHHIGGPMSLVNGPIAPMALRHPQHHQHVSTAIPHPHLQHQSMHQHQEHEQMRQEEMRRDSTSSVTPRQL
ncbi:hypothetical protein HDU85_003539 [Gaertneriomyces sp. JEL0708]|nr:hypothetical protein HDU85_003539 [Gaertneriomyces sp. JEL0708]